MELDAFDLAFDKELDDEAALLDTPEQEGDEPVAEAAVEAEPVEPEAPAVEEAKDEPPKVEAAKEPEAPRVDPAQEAAAKQVEADRLALEEAEKLTFEPTAEEATRLKQLEEDFPEIAEALKIQRRVMEAKLNHEVKQRTEAALAAVNTRVAPALQAAAENSYNKFKTAVMERHADAFDILPEVEAWVEKQPGFLKDAYNRVLDSGSVQETVELYDTFRATSPKASDNHQKPADPQKDQKLKSLEGVRGRQSSRRNTIDPNDFDSAFDAFAGSV